MRVVEMYYTIGEVCFLLRYSHTWVKQEIKKGNFGPHVLDIRGEYRIPASGLNTFLEQHHLDPRGIKPRSRGTFLRKMKRNGELNGDCGDGRQQVARPVANSTLQADEDGEQKLMHPPA